MWERNIRRENRYAPGRSSFIFLSHTFLFFNQSDPLLATRGRGGAGASY
jgi:hypothetical protein